MRSMTLLALPCAPFLLRYFRRDAFLLSVVAAAGLVALGLALGAPLAFLAVEEHPVGSVALRLSR